MGMGLIKEAFQSFNHFKSVLAHQFYVRPGDRNYYLARFSAINGMYDEFWWQSLQAIEKYLKAGLILNGASVKSERGHDVASLWKRHVAVLGASSLKLIYKPKKLHSDFWRGEAIESFLDQTNAMGHPDSRYGLVSHVYQKSDLFILDQIAFELRRRTVGLDWIVGADFPCDELGEYHGKTFRELLDIAPHVQVRKLKSPKFNLDIVGENSADFFYSWNLAFSRSSKDWNKPVPRGVVPVIPTFANSYVFILWNSLERTDIDDDVKERIHWMLDNIKLGKEVVKAFEQRLAAS